MPDLDAAKTAIAKAQLLIAEALADLNAVPVTPTPPTPTAFYQSPSDHTPHTKPAPITLGPAGFTFTDPIFGSRMLRVTDEKTNGGQSVHCASNSNLCAWNADSTRFFAMGSGGNVLMFSFDAASFTTKLLPITAPSTNVEPCFSYGNPDLLWTVAGTSLHTVMTFSLSTGKRTIIKDLELAFPSVKWLNTYIGSFQVVDNDQWFAVFGGGSQDQHMLAHHGGRNVTLDTTPLGWKIHAGAIDRTGRYVLIFPTAPDLQRLKIAQVQIWDTQTNALTPMSKFPGGHGACGFGTYINQDSAVGDWDAAQWLLRDLATPDTLKSLIPQVQRPKETYLSDHQSWRANKANASVPVVSSTYRSAPPAGSPAEPWRAWDEEIIAVATDGSGVVNRFCHHQSTYATGSDFWDQPICNVDPSGHYAIVTSNWGKTVGTGRQDVFLVELK
jgi:hypothetical protein